MTTLPLCPEAVPQLSRMLRWALLLGLSLHPQTLRAQNFICSDLELQHAAEVARDRSANFWSGHPLPGPWYQPCPIEWSGSQRSGQGVTRYRLAEGEVFGWQMTVLGDRNTVLRDVLPHEVDHAVRASLVRRALPRWLDEGCASVAESAPSHAQLRSQLRLSRRRILTSETIDAMSYPTSSTSTQQLYAEGFSLVEYLLLQRPRSDLLRVQQAERPLSQSLPAVYQVELPQLLADWTNWEQSRLRVGTTCDCVGCPWHHPLPQAGPVVSERPVLTVWSASWCGPCLAFQQDLQRHPGFRQTLEKRFRIVMRDIDQQPRESGQSGILSVPVFLADTRRIEGYQGPEWLLRELGLTMTPPTPVHAPPSS